MRKYLFLLLLCVITLSCKSKKCAAYNYVVIENSK